MSDNVDVPCEMCGRYGCDPKHHEPMSYARGGFIDLPSSPVSDTKPAPGPEMPPFPRKANETALAASMRYVMETYGSGATIKRLTETLRNCRRDAEGVARRLTITIENRDARIERLKAEGDRLQADLERSRETADDEIRRNRRLWEVIEANGATNSQLMRERDEARVDVKRMTVYIKDLRDAISVLEGVVDKRNVTIKHLKDLVCDREDIIIERDATIKTLMRERNEARINTALNRRAQ